MTGHIDPTKETFAAFRADDRPVMGVALIGADSARPHPSYTGLAVDARPAKDRLEVRA